MSCYGKKHHVNAQQISGPFLHSEALVSSLHLNLSAVTVACSASGVSGHGTTPHTYPYPSSPLDIPLLSLIKWCMPTPRYPTRLLSKPPRPFSLFDFMPPLPPYRSNREPNPPFSVSSSPVQGLTTHSTFVE
eukprot:753705-Hanusia_phi.AAC.2